MDPNETRAGWIILAAVAALPLVALLNTCEAQNREAIERTYLQQLAEEARQRYPDPTDPVELAALRCARASERTDAAIAECYISRGLSAPF